MAIVVIISLFLCLILRKKVTKSFDNNVDLTFFNV